MSIINAKFSPTAVEKGFIQRTSVLDDMKRDISKNLILIVGPAGYGKTTLLSQYHDQTDEKLIWYHVDYYDDEVVTFVTYFTECIARCLGKTQAEVTTMPMEALNESNLKNYVADLLNYLSINCTERIGIILDDYHYISKPQINEYMSIFLRYMPANIRIIMASRTKPAIDLDFLITSNKLLEINVDKLKFTSNEEMTYINQVTKTLKPVICDKQLIKKNNGWPFGLNLLQHAMKENITEDYEIKDLYKKCFDNIYHILDDQAFLLSTSMLEVLDIEACNFVANRSNAQETLEKMFNQGLFISKTHLGGYRYHDLFRDYLNNKVKNKKDILEKIAAFYQSKGNNLEAIDYLLSCEAYEEVDLLLKQEDYKFISTTYYTKVYHWDKKIPKKIGLMFGSLCLIKALIALKDLNIQQGALYVEKARDLLEKQNDDAGCLKTQIIWTKVLRLQEKYEEAYELANRIYEQIANKDLDEKMDILTEKLNAGSFLCKVTEESVVLKNEIQEIDEHNIKPYEIQALALYEYASYLIGDYRAAMEIQARYRNHLAPLNSIVYTIRIYMVWGHLEEGKKHILREIDNAKRFERNSALPELYGILAEIEFHMGHFEEAEKYFKESMALFDDKNNNLYHLNVFTYINALIFLGRKEEGLALIEQHYKGISKDNIFGFMMADMMLSQTFLLLDDFEKAIYYAQKAMLPSVNFGTRLYIATLSAVLATCYIHLGDVQKARGYAEESMRLSVSGYYIQDFITYYEYYRPLYDFCVKNNIQKAFINEITERVSQKPKTITGTKEALHVQFFGDNIVRVKEQLLKWRTNKAKHVFYYLLYQGKTGVTKDKLIDTFFENNTWDKANGNLRTTMTYIRRALQDVGFEDLVYQMNGRYFIKEDHIQTDITVFNQLYHRYLSRETDILEICRALCEIYKGAFCEDIDLYEFNIEKEKYLNQFERVLLEAIGLLENQGAYKEALGLVNRLILHQKYNEDYYVLKRDLYEKLGDEKMVKKTVEALERLKEQ